MKHLVSACSSCWDGLPRRWKASAVEGFLHTPLHPFDLNPTPFLTAHPAHPPPAFRNHQEIMAGLALNVDRASSATDVRHRCRRADNASSATAGTSHPGDLHQGREGSARSRSGAAGPPRLVASRGKTTQSTLLAFVLFFIRLDVTWAAGGFCWKWGSLGQNCDTVCTSVALVCVKKFDKVGSEDDFKAASGGGVGCSSYVGWSGGTSPMKSGGTCIYQTGSTGDCTSSNSDLIRLCSCQCAAGTFSNSDLKSWPCEE